MSKKDLFDDTTMTFGEHLEVLRMHLWRAIVGLFVGTIVAFYVSKPVIVAIQRPIEKAMGDVFLTPVEETALVQEADKGFTEIFKQMWRQTFGGSQPDQTSQPQPVDTALRIQIDARQVARSLHEVQPERYPAPPEESPPVWINVTLEGTPFGVLVDKMRRENLRPRTDGVDEAFMIYLKVSLVIGLFISSPWILYQLWLFVAAGLYPNERRYVYTYMPLSIALFVGGAAFCFFIVIPYVLKFLLGFNVWLGLRPEIKISSWIMFSLMVSLMFGISFQLPMVMLVLERIGIVDVRFYKEKRRWAILIISFLSMVLTPSDPVSMIMMLVPLTMLYEFGIFLCGRRVAKPSPFGAQTA
jgi:sec-independent protein translocase protein TatC